MVEDISALGLYLWGFEPGPKRPRVSTALLPRPAPRGVRDPDGALRTLRVLLLQGLGGGAGPAPADVL